MQTFSLLTSVSLFFWHFESKKNVWNQTRGLPKCCHITSRAEITANSQDCFSTGTHPPITVISVFFFSIVCFLFFIFLVFFVCWQIRKKLPLFETCFCLGDTLVGFGVQILNSQINCWKMQHIYCGAFLLSFLVALTDRDIHWPTGVQWENVKWILLLKEIILYYLFGIKQDHVVSFLHFKTCNLWAKPQLKKGKSINSYRWETSLNVLWEDIFFLATADVPGSSTRPQNTRFHTHKKSKYKKMQALPPSGRKKQLRTAN